VALWLGFPLLRLSAGCRIVQTAVDVPGQAVRAVTPKAKDTKAVYPVEVQQALLRFADEFSSAMITGVEKLLQ
jgi:hypothetical protein